MRWRWNAANKWKHRLSFETALRVFDDPLAVSRPDQYPYEERWQTIGMVSNIIILVVHTMPTLDPIANAEIGRIISARKATPHERRAYEEDCF